MNRPKWSLTLVFSVLILISAISAMDIYIRDKRAPPDLRDMNKDLDDHPSANLLYNPNMPTNAVEAAPAKLAQYAQSDGAKPKKKLNFKIAETLECAADVKTFCSDKVNSNNILVLDCLQDNEKVISKLSDGCHHVLWRYKLKLTKDSRFEDASNEACAPELERIPECKSLDKGEVIPCLIEHYDDIKSKPCSQFLNKMVNIIFSDYRLMSFFIKGCKDDVVKLNCGRIDAVISEDDSPHSQGNTVACLNNHRKDLSKTCKKSILRVAELESDDFHLDRPLYYACKGDRDNLCHDVVAGEGAVFKCLYKHLGDARLSDNCRINLEERQQLIAEDVKIDKSFYASCKEDIRVNNCTLKGSRNGDREEDYSRSSILLCLEEAHSKMKEIKQECLQEMFELRSELMQDYKISPELVSACEAEIKNFCPLREDDNVLQCLMREISQSRQNKGRAIISSDCTAEVIKLLEVVNPGENIALDAPLMRACGDVVTQACSEYDAGQGDVITCLLENLDHEDMTDECEDNLLVIQYFAARDFRLDFHLFKQCRSDAITLCHSNGFSEPSSMKPDEGSIIFSCLHRHLRSTDPSDTKLSRQCTHEIKRVMRERSFRINLMPEVEEACLEDLSTHCTDEDEHRKFGGEMECLQSLDFLTEKCKAAVTNFTQEASEDMEVDRTLMRSCHSMAKRFCSELLNSDALPIEVLDCLIINKNHNDMQEKCAASIEHHQIISLKDFRFNARFHAACEHSVSLFCKTMRTKYQVVACLSELVRNDTLKEEPQRIDDGCRKQLKFEILQRGETLDLDPELKKSCESEIRTLCHNMKNGEGEVVECLRAHKGKLSDVCYQVLFKREKDDALFGDYSLQHVCNDAIKKYCTINADETDILRCLIENKNQIHSFGDKCRQLVQHRQIEQAQDIELNPHLQKACRLDIPKFCADVYKDRSQKGRWMEGKVIDCLKKAYASKNKVLTAECKHEIQFRIKEAAVDINLNQVLLRTCKTDIKKFCLDNIANMEAEDVEGRDGYSVFGSGTIMECLKKHFKDLMVPKCKEEVAFTVAESRVDLNVDPLLHTACQQDLVTHCKNIAQGQGRQTCHKHGLRTSEEAVLAYERKLHLAMHLTTHVDGKKMSCLLSYLQSNPTALTRNCKDTLQSRKNLWESAAQVAPAESFSEIFDQMSSSPARNYFFAIVFTFVGIIFIVGLTCGHVTKRVRAEIKNK